MLFFFVKSWYYVRMTVIAEIGTSHAGSQEKAHKLIDAAVSAGADCVKFQWVYAEEILHPNTGFVTLPGGSVRLYDRFKELEVSPDFFADCLSYAHSVGVSFACSPFGLRSLKELIDIRPDFIKIASPEVNHIPLLKSLSESDTDIPVILSSGVSTLGDIETAVSILTKKDRPLTLLHCITSYPAPEEEYNVRCVHTLQSVFGVATGISDHSLDPVLVPALTVAMGGTMIEKHITLSKKTDGLDDPVALEPEQFAHMVHAVHQAQAVVTRWNKELFATCGAKDSAEQKLQGVSRQAQEEIIRQLSDQYGTQKVNAILGTGTKRLAPSEQANYGRTNRSLHYKTALPKGHILNAEDIAVLRTEKVLTPGIHPSLLDTVTGAMLTHDVSAGEGVLLTDVMNKTQQ